MADRLKAEVDSAALQIVRHYLDAKDEAFEISVTTHPADRFTFSMEMVRARESGRESVSGIAGRRNDESDAVIK